MGDLNEILYDHEKEGGRTRPRQYMQAFHNAMDDCDLHDLGYMGDSFMWHRGMLRSRLDRAIRNDSWRQMQDKAAVIHLEYNHSDHRPLLLDTEYYPASSATITTKHLNFEAKWLKEENFSEVVEKAWLSAAQSSDSIDVLERLKAMHAGLHAWDNRVLSRPKKQLRSAQRELELLMRGPLSSDNESKIQEVAERIEKMLEQEEIKWNQHSRANWLQNGDKTLHISIILPRRDKGEIL
jgi:hypothetical protein